MLGPRFLWPGEDCGVRGMWTGDEMSWHFQSRTSTNNTLVWHAGEFPILFHPPMSEPVTHHKQTSPAPHGHPSRYLARLGGSLWVWGTCLHPKLINVLSGLRK